MQFEQAELNDRTQEQLQISNPSPRSVHLVIAATGGEDISWAFQFESQGFKIIHYVADDPSWPHHPPANRGHESIMYHSYFQTYYDDLPDIAILVHAKDISWHMEPLLDHSVSYAISRLDLDAVEQRGYANLRVSWENACPDYINTSLTGTDDLEFEGQCTRKPFWQTSTMARGFSKSLRSWHSRAAANLLSRKMLSAQFHGSNMIAPSTGF